MPPITVEVNVPEPPEPPEKGPRELGDHRINEVEMQRLRQIDREFRDSAEKSGEPKGTPVFDVLSPERESEDASELKKQPDAKEHEYNKVDKSGRLGPKAEAAIVPPARPEAYGWLETKPRVFLEGGLPGAESYQARINDEVRQEGLGYFSENDKLLPDDGRGAEAAATAYATRVTQHEAAAQQAQEKPDDPEPQTPAIPEAPAQHAEPTAEASEPAVEVTTDQPPDKTPDAPLPEATTEQHPEKEPKETRINRVICDLTDTGIQGRGVLDCMQRDYPRLYGHEDFKVVIGASTDERRDLLMKSGAFTQHLEANKVEFRTIGSQDTLPEGTLLTLAPEPNVRAPLRMMKDDDGNVMAIMDSVFLIGDDEIVAVDETKSGVATNVDPTFFAYFDTTHSPMALPLARNLSGRLSASLNTGDIRDTPLGRKERVVASVMNDAPNGYPINYQPDLREDMARLATQSELVHITGFMSELDSRPSLSDLAHRRGLIVDTMTEISTLRQAAADAKAAINVVPAKPGEYHYVLLDQSEDKAARTAVLTEYSTIVTAPTNEAESLLSTAKGYFAREQETQAKAGAPESDASAADMVVSAYESLLERSPRAVLDHDLALNLATMFKKNHCDDLALKYADKAIAATPQIAANAHLLKADILLGKAGDEAARQAAREELVEAHSISPKDYEVYQGLAKLARAEGDDAALLGALIEQQRYAPSGDKWSAVSAWEEMIQTTVRMGENTPEDEPGQIIIEEYTHFDPDTRRYVTTYSEPKPLSAREVLLREAATMRESALVAIQRLFDSEMGQDQDAAMERIQNSINPELLGAIELPEHLQLNEVDAEAAKRLHDLRRDATISIATRFAILQEVVENEERSGRRGAVMLGYEIDPETGARIGSSGSGDRIIVPYTYINRNGEINGQIGYGKTTTEMALALAFANDGVSVMLVDSGNRPQYLPFVKSLEDRRIPVNYLSPTDPNAAFISLGLLQPRPGYPAQVYLDDLKAMWDMLTNAREPFSNFVDEATQKFYASLGYDIEVDGLPNINVLAIPRIARIRPYTDSIVNTAEYAGYSTVAGDVTAFTGRRTGQAKVEPIGSLIDTTGQMLDADRLIREASVYDVTGIKDPARKALAVAAMVLKLNQSLEARRQEMGNRDLPLNFVLIIGEAALVLGKPTVIGVENMAQIERAERFSQIMTQWRGPGAAIIASSQNRNLISNVSDNSVVKIVHRTDSPEAQAEAARVLRASDAQREMLGRLKPGQALIYTPDMDRSGPKLMQVKDIPREEAKLTEPRLADPPIAGVQPSRALTNREARLARTQAASSKSANLRFWLTSLTISHMSNTPLGKSLPGIKEWWESTSERQREAVLDAAVDNIIEDRASVLPYEAEILKNRVKDVAASHLSGVPIAGRQPGTSLTVPELVWAKAYEKDKWPYYDRTPDEYGPAEKVTGLPGSPIPDTTVREQVEALEKHEHAALPGFPENQKTFWIALLGKSNGAALYGSIAQIFKGNVKDRPKQLRLLEEQMGLVKPGEPIAGPLSKLLSLPNRLLFKEAA